MRKPGPEPLKKARSLLERIAAHALIVVLSAAAIMSANPSFAGASRVLFDEDFTWLTREGADRLLQRAQAAGFDTVIPCVWHGRGVSWPSKLAPREPKWETVTQQNPDPLRYLVTRAHEMGLRIHPWVTVGLRQRDFFQEFAEPGTPEKAFNWHHSGYRDWIAHIILELVQQYEIDGVNLDYVRTKGHCTAASCLRDYELTQRRTLHTDITTRAVDRTARQALMEWNMAAVGEVIEHVATEARRLRPGIVISIDSLAGDDLWMEQGANGLTWAQQGWIDILYHMDYGVPLNSKYLTQLHRRVQDPTKVVILIGNYDISSNGSPAPRSARALAALLKESRDLWPESPVTALYEYRFLTEEQAALLQADRASTANSPTTPARTKP